MIESGQDALSLIGQAWDVWLAATSSSSLSADESTSKAENKQRQCEEKPIVSTMPHKKALCYGFCPTQDEFFLLRCKDCGLLVKPIAYRHHQNTRHAVRRPSQDVHDREPNCSSRIRSDSGPTPGLSVFSPDSSSHTPDDFDGILLSPVAPHPTSATPEGARLCRESQSTSPPTVSSSISSSSSASQETRTGPDGARRKPPPNNRPKKTLRTIMPVKGAQLRTLAAMKAEDTDSYCVKQHGDLVMKFSKNIAQAGGGGNDIRAENRKPRNRRKQELTISPSPNGKGSNVIKSFDLVTPPCTPDRLKADIAAVRSHSSDILRTTR
uniref:C2H2-type domain-containing protein n=1 Tax=Plectus sambesii TaxID=2011161 RepID=A0A914UL80_9BILA